MMLPPTRSGMLDGEIGEQRGQVAEQTLDGQPLGEGYVRGIYAGSVFYVWP